MQDAQTWIENVPSAQGREVLAVFPVAGFFETPATAIRSGDTLDMGNGGIVVVASEPQRFLGYVRFETASGGRWMVRDDLRARVRP